LANWFVVPLLISDYYGMGDRQWSRSTEPVGNYGKLFCAGATTPEGEQRLQYVVDESAVQLGDASRLLRYLLG
jgi:hypothetical protein